MEASGLSARWATLSDAEKAKVLAQLSDDDVRELLRFTETLNEFIPRANAKFTAPAHLQQLVKAIEASQTEELRLVVHAPPRHGKTETILNGFAWLLGKDPTRRHAYASYEANLAKSKSRKARQIATATGVQLSATRLDEWLTTEGGGLFATGVGGPLTGRGVTGLMVVDDPIKNRVEAESEATRERNWEWFNEVAYTRLEPGSSCIVCMTRWHPQDLAGRLVDEKGWKYIRLPALDENEQALAPHLFDAERLADIREQVGEYTWSSLYQGVPRKRGGSVFGDVHYYEPAATSLTGCRLALGIDCAYSAKTHADYSVAIVLAELNGVFYVLDVQRHQIKAPEFKVRIDALRRVHGVRRSRWYTATTEEGTADLLGVTAQLARGDKFVRAQPVAAAWNAGKLLVPRTAPWADHFIAEVCSFTGIGDKRDDQVDALAAGFDVLDRAGSAYEGLDRDTLPPRRM